MRIKRFEDVKPFLARVEKFLMREEAVNNLALGILYKLASDISGRDNQEHFLALVENNQQTVFVMVRNTSYLILYGEGDKLNEAIDLAVSYTLQSGINAPGVIGPTKIVEKFAQLWQKLNHSTITLHMKQRIYRLDHVNEIKYSPGRLRVANIGDYELLKNWAFHFMCETPEQPSRERAVELVEGGIEKSAIYVWENKKTVSMVKTARASKNGVAVNLVYTPPEYRNRGYATSCVAAFSQMLLDKGYNFCSLYTDLANPTSNEMYKRIGYKTMEDSVVYKFH